MVSQEPFLYSVRTLSSQHIDSDSILGKSTASLRGLVHANTTDTEQHIFSSAGNESYHPEVQSGKRSSCRGMWFLARSMRIARALRWREHCWSKSSRSPVVPRFWVWPRPRTQTEAPPTSRPGRLCSRTSLSPDIRSPKLGHCHRVDDATRRTAPPHKRETFTFVETINPASAHSHHLMQRPSLQSDFSGNDLRDVENGKNRRLQNTCRVKCFYTLLRHE